MQKERLLIFIVTYNAEKTIDKVLNRIPNQIFNDPRFETEILVIDDGSSDRTFAQGIDYKNKFSSCPLTVLKNPVNLGYGGNQKLGYRYAIDKGFTMVALLHGDGQYAPEELPKLVEPFFYQNNPADAVFGSRMMNGTAALSGGMPLYKFVGNKVLTFLENAMIGLKLSEWHSGYRLYSTRLLRNIPFELNSNGFDFDSEIIIQTAGYKGNIVELPIPTFYGDEISHVNVIQYGLKILWACFQYRAQKLSLFYDPKFDLQTEASPYQEKFSFTSSHSLALEKVGKNDSCLILGCGPLEIVTPFIKATKDVALIDIALSDEIKALGLKSWELDLNINRLDVLTNSLHFNKVLILDVIEHLNSPENFCDHLRDVESCKGAEIIFSTPNVAFLPVRLMLLLGFFNYGKRGILDRTHTRLFTYYSLRRLLRQSGFEIKEIRGVPAPFQLAIGRNWLSDLLTKTNNFFCTILPGLFSFQILVVAKTLPRVNSMLNDTKKYSEETESALKNLQM